MEVMEIGEHGLNARSHVEVDHMKGLVNAIIRHQRIMVNLAVEEVVKLVNAVQMHAQVQISYLE